MGEKFYVIIILRLFTDQYDIELGEACFWNEARMTVCYVDVCIPWFTVWNEFKFGRLEAGQASGMMKKLLK